MNNKKKIGLAGRLAGFFLKNREFSVLTIIVLFAWGIFSFIVMPKQYNPEIVAPAFNVVTEFPGATSTQVHELVTRPMEDAIKEIPTVDEVMSQSSEGGRSTVTVKFYIGENLEDAKITLAQKLRSNIDLKPIGVSEPMIQAIAPEDIPIVTIGLVSESLSEKSLRKLAFDMADFLKLAEDTSKIEVIGGRKGQLNIELDAGKLNTYEISLPQVISAIESNNSNVLAGTIKNDQNNFSVKLDAQIENEKDLRNIIVKKNGSTSITLSDIAKIEYGTDEIKNFASFSDKNKTAPAAYIAISKLKGANANTVSKNISEKLEQFSPQIPAGVEVITFRDDGKVSNEAVMNLTSNLFLSIAIVFLVLIVFLSLKSAMIVAIAIPLTLAAVFGMGNFAGESINRITLFALILSLGLLVDSATVVIENIWRLLKENPQRKKREVIVEAVDEVGGGLLMSTITTILAFYPMAFVTGMMGPYMGPIPFFVPAALIASLLIAYTINPFLADVFIKKKTISKNRPGSENIILKKMQSLRTKYTFLLNNLLNNSKKRKRVLIASLILFLIAISLPATKIVKFRMLPKADKQQFYVYLDMPSDTSIEKTNEMTEKMTNVLLENEHVQSVQNFVGQSQVIDFNGLFKGSQSRVGENQATLKVNLSHKDDRKQTSEEIVLQMRPKLYELIQVNPNAKIKLIEDPPGPPVLSTVLVKIKGSDYESLQKIAHDVEGMLSQTSEVKDIDNSVDESGIQFTFKIDHEKASYFGVTATDISRSMQTALTGTAAGLFHQSEQGIRKPEQEYIFIQLQKSDRDNHIDLNKIYVGNNKGQTIPLSELATQIQSPPQLSIWTDEREKTIFVSAEMGNRSATYAMIDMLSKMYDYKLPDGSGKLSSFSLFGTSYKDQHTGESYSILLDGEWKLTLEVFRDLGLAMAVAIFLIYFVLVAQFRSLSVPLLVMGTIPLAMIGVMPGFAILGALKGTYFNATSMIGVIALSGIVVNNAIILLEYLNELKEKGYAIKDALVEAGKTRFLPIILTSITTILGSLTIISDPVWEGLAWSIVWGLSLSAALTLVIFPLLYYTFEKKNWENHKK